MTYAYAIIAGTIIGIYVIYAVFIDILVKICCIIIMAIVTILAALMSPFGITRTIIKSFSGVYKLAVNWKMYEENYPITAFIIRELKQ